MSSEADWQIGRLADWQIGRLADWQIGRLADWQIGRLKNSSRDQRSLMSAGIALKNLVATGVQDAVCRTTTVGTAKTIGPASTLQCRRAKRFGAKELVELRHRQAGLKLDAVHSHDATLKSERQVQITPAQVHQVSLAEDCC
jgi:hypothetical protein